MCIPVNFICIVFKSTDFEEHQRTNSCFWSNLKQVDFSRRNTVKVAAVTVNLINIKLHQLSKVRALTQKLIYFRHVISQTKTSQTYSKDVTK